MQSRLLQTYLYWVTSAVILAILFSVTPEWTDLTDAFSSGGSRIFPREGAGTPKVGVLIYYFCWKMHGNERIWASLAPPLDPPMFRFAVGHDSELWMRTGTRDIQSSSEFWPRILKSIIDFLNFFASHFGIIHKDGYWVKRVLRPVADPGYPWSGGINSKGGSEKLLFHQISQKKHENERIWTPLASIPGVSP